MTYVGVGVNAGEVVVIEVGMAPYAFDGPLPGVDRSDLALWIRKQDPAWLLASDVVLAPQGDAWTQTVRPPPLPPNPHTSAPAWPGTWT